MTITILVIALASGLALVGVRGVIRRQGGDHSQAAEVVAVFGAIGAAYFLLLALALTVGPWVMSPGMPPFATGALFGLVVAGIRFAAMASVHLLAWGLGQDAKIELGRPQVTSALAMVCGSAVVGGLFFSALIALDSLLGPFTIFALPVFLAGYPLLDLVVMPRVTRFTKLTRPIGAADRYHETLPAWVSETACAAGLRRHRLEVVETGVDNAWAIHMPPFTPTILLSRTLLEQHSEDSVRAVVAHEIAHITSNHVPRLTLITVLGTVLYALFIPFLFESGLPGGIATGGLLVGLTGLLTVGLGPSWFSRRFEYEADAIAASIVGASGMQQALLDLSQDSERTYDGSFTHPPMASRIDRLGVAES